MKKAFAILLGLALMLSLTVPAMAATVTNTTGHSYDAYQVFTGSQAESEGALGNIGWGNGVNPAGLLTDLKATCDYFDSCETAAEVANVLKGKADKCDEALALANAAAKNLTGNKTPIAANADSVTLDDGYYLVVDTSVVTGTNDARNSALLQVTEEISITKKYSVPTVEKKVTDVNDSTGETTGLQDSADYDIGDPVPFTLTGTLPENLADYDTYKYVFHDTLTNGLTYNGDAKVYLDSVEGTDITTYFDIAPNAAATTGGGTLTISAKNNNIKLIPNVNKDSKIIVVYTATLNEQAEIGVNGNPNYVKLEFSNDPNWKPEEGTEPTGKTPEDKVIVFTYKVIVNKVDGEENPLEGAKFTLYKKNAAGVYVAIGEAKTGVASVEGGKANQFSWVGLDDGDYKLEETVTPAGYNTISPIEFTISATHDTTWEQQLQTAILTALAGGDKFTGAVSTGAVSAEVINNAGATLPETGGMGTTIFYIVGGVMVAAAVVLLITKKRMSAEG